MSVEPKPESPNRVKEVAILAAAAVTVTALVMSQDGLTLAAFFSFLGGLGLGKLL